MTVGERIKSLRSRACLTQTELGKRIGWPDSRISAYERGEVKRPNSASIERLARAFEMTYGEFMDNVDMPKPRSNAYVCDE